MSRIFWVIVVLASFFGVYEGSQFFKSRGEILAQVQASKIAKEKAGDPKDAVFSKSMYPPACGDLCPSNIARYVLEYKGDVATFIFAMDYDRKTKKMSNIVVCNEKGERIFQDSGAPETCR